MKISDLHPTFEEFVKNEVDSLEYICNRGLLSYFDDLQSTICNYTSYYKSKIKKGKFDKFEFHASFYMEVEKQIRNVLIGSVVDTDFKECSYFLVIVNEEDNNKIIRKFHFDYATPANTTKQRVPTFHLQYGGKMSPKMAQAGLNDSKLDNWLSVPRLNFSPINLALLFDILLCEFKTVETNEVIQTSEWRTLIYNNENFLSANYFKTIAAHLQSQQHTPSRLLRDFCYGD